MSFENENYNLYWFKDKFLAVKLKYSYNSFYNVLKSVFPVKLGNAPNTKD